MPQICSRGHLDPSGADLNHHSLPSESDRRELVVKICCPSAARMATQTLACQALKQRPHPRGAGRCLPAWLATGGAFI